MLAGLPAFRLFGERQKTPLSRIGFTLELAVSTLKAFWTDHPEFRDAEGPTLAWYRDVLKADWSKPSEVKEQFADLEGTEQITAAHISEALLFPTNEPLPWPVP